jgi:hypothetical protein
VHAFLSVWLAARGPTDTGESQGHLDVEAFDRLVGIVVMLNLLFKPVQFFQTYTRGVVVVSEQDCCYTV